MMRLTAIATAFVTALLVSSFSYADSLPPCLDDNGNAVTVNNAQVIQWESSTPNQFLARGNVHGPVVALYPNQTGHAHFAIQIGSDPSETLEVIYDLDFGAIPTVQLGMQVQACGDYITSNQATKYYPVSPCGAIIHWIHADPAGENHPGGFLTLNGQLYGQDLSNAGPAR
jgi:hypothetical protein